MVYSPFVIVGNDDALTFHMQAIYYLTERLTLFNKKFQLKVWCFCLRELDIFYTSLDRHPSSYEKLRTDFITREHVLAAKLD
ncbi:hypothetical protein BIY21_19940 [Vibrio ponticus]|uniref:Uncharacterized protein n=1 Tax=Vibrio ponticus TaxID=265668 RepID=A0ABX3F414_9VIBR|nr:hypothetical protein BIY21_19940 [Vibrio ponticus]